MTKQTYEEAIAEIEALLKAIEDPQRSLTDIAGDVRRAKELISFCRTSLKANEEDLDKLLSDEEQQD